MKDFKFRKYQAADYSLVKQLWLKSGLLLSLSDKKNELQILANQDSNNFFIVEREEEIIGTAICAFDGRRGYIHHVAVRPDYQNKGIGKLIMDRAMDFYKNIRAVKVHIMIERSNKDVINFYKSLGWEIRDDLYLMTKVLRDEEFSLDE
ncbi:MAG: GNAT family N-acetyltransferase [Candidatus Kariarchaeaceae archaeon]|jgi:ribosomal protein S18 acetylase RimI-like enzyme